MVRRRASRRRAATGRRATTSRRRSGLGRLAARAHDVEQRQPASAGRLTARSSPRPRSPPRRRAAHRAREAGDDDRRAQHAAPPACIAHEHCARAGLAMHARRSASRAARTSPSGARQAGRPSRIGVELTDADAAGNAHDLADRDDAARAVGHPRLVDDEVHRAGHLLADRLVRQPESGHQRERLDAPQRLLRRTGMDGRQRAVVAAGHRREHVERLGAADLPDDDAVRPHAQRVSHEPADRHLAASLQRCRARLEPHDVRMAQPQLGGVLDRHDPLAVADELGQRVERRRLARARPAGDEDVAAGAARRLPADRAAARPRCRSRRDPRGRSRGGGTAGSSAPSRRARAAPRSR